MVMGLSACCFTRGCAAGTCRDIIRGEMTRMGGGVRTGTGWIGASVFTGRTLVSAMDGWISGRGFFTVGEIACTG